MAIVVNTNVQSIQVQNNLNRVTDAMNTAMERMTTGSKINSAADDAAGLVISKGIEVQTRGTQVAKSNAQSGTNLLQTAEGNLSVMQDNFMRIRDLTLQAMNGGQTEDQLQAMQEEATARLAEIDRIATGAKFNTFDLFGGETRESDAETVTLQIGTGSDGATNTIEIADVFNDAHVSTLTGQAAFTSSFVGTDLTEMQAQLDQLDTAITEISSRRGTIGSTINRLDSVMNQLDTQYENLSAANSRITDADIATESSNYIKNQILQQASASLLTQANQQPNIALSLI